MNIETNNEILSFTNYLIANDYTVNPVSEELKRRYLLANWSNEYYMIELGALGTDEEGYGIYRIQDPKARDRVSPVVPISNFNPAEGIKV